MDTPGEIEQPVILFDGVCNLCNSSVLFIIQRDPKAKFRFASLQSDFGKNQMRAFGLNETELNSVLLVKQGRLFQKSDAALEIARQLTGGWPLLYGFKIVPAVWRDWVYSWISRNRYKWFGKKDACMVPTPELKVRFVS
ncbi:MAG: thiol-disulfide oxidoreductase DCC family protein [Cyclobacteriaceae bacterium]|nr:MAG: thiol-disulfide oxidoreductase DCC family protein [Cyclobacteriaceae bacterium]